jgi:hypothetical protein
MTRFCVGEIAEYQSQCCPQGWTEVTVTAIYTDQSLCTCALCGRLMRAYGAYYDVSPSNPDGRAGVAFGCELRKRRPPSELSTWDRVEQLTGWRPRSRSVFRDAASTDTAWRRLVP